MAEALTQPPESAACEMTSAELVLKYENDEPEKKIIDWSAPNTAYHRLQYVCGVLTIMAKMSGQMPVDYSGPEFEIPSAECFELLKKAMDKQDDSQMTFRELWDFANVLYMNLRQLHDPTSPLNSAMAPDPFVLSKVDSELKQAMKGEIINFLVRTARDFASNNADVEIASTTSAGASDIQASGFSRVDFNRISWIPQAFQVAGRTCYKATGSNLYLYFRPGTGRWVIDDEIVPSGAAYAASRTSSMQGSWATSQNWTPAPWVQVRLQADGSYCVSGCKGNPDDSGASSSILDNGVYVKSEDKVNGKPQYIRRSPELQARGEQRHLIWSETRQCWKITPTCGEDEGAHLAQESKTMQPVDNQWMIIPADTNDSVRFNNTGMGGKAVVPLAKAKEGSSEADDMDEEDEGESGDRKEEDLDQLAGLTPWNDRNHESLVFSNRTSTLAFFSAKPHKLRARMNPALVKWLETNKITVGQDLHSAVPEKYHRLLCALTNVSRGFEESSTLLGGRFAITGDALLKFLAIVNRVRCGIPVVLLGECGCGKTYTIRYLAAFLKVELFVLDVHGGTTEDDVVSVVDRASKYVKETGREAMVFMDEINACAHLGLIEEVLVQRAVFGKRLDDRLVFLGALNPYREVKSSRDKDEGERAGLTYQQASSVIATTGQNALKDKNLVYLVHPVPSALVHVAFDFGALMPQEERFYITSMCASAMEDAAKSFDVVGPWILNPAFQALLVEWICAAQYFVRDSEKDPSAASLRDAARTLKLTLFFISLADKRPSTQQKPLVGVSNCAVLGLAFGYVFRLSSRKLRTRFWEAVRVASLSNTVKWLPALQAFKREGTFEAVLASTQRAFCSKFDLEPGIALNDALSENLFVSVVCILNRVPLFLVGKPGTSKTLALQIAASNLLGKASPVKFWRRFPALAMFTYQCSPLSTATEIKRQFQLACRFQQHASEQISVFVLDEVGLAEFSPHLPLKVLHSILVDPPVAVVGVSNWTLDRAKMNRAILITRPEPSVFDLRFTGERISKSFSQKRRPDADDAEQTPAEAEGVQTLAEKEKELDEEWWLEGLATTFHSLYLSEHKSGREFWGMRDYYALVRHLKMAPRVDKETLIMALCRNLGGKPEHMEGIVLKFLDAIFPSAA